jgi:DNA-binding IclR family transcriptional regulator
MGVREPPARKLQNLATARSLRAVEVLAFQPVSTVGLAATMGLSTRTARRMLRTLEQEGYAQTQRGTGRQRHVYSLTPRLLALAGQLAARLPLVVRGEQTVRQLHRSTGLDAYLVIPSYGDVIALAGAGAGAPVPWSLLPAADCAGGRLLLAYRHSWRDRQRPSDEPARQPDLDASVRQIRDRGYAMRDDGRSREIAVAVPASAAPLAALVVRRSIPAPVDDGEAALLSFLRRAAAELGREV